MNKPIAGGSLIALSIFVQFLNFTCDSNGTHTPVAIFDEGEWPYITTLTLGVDPDEEVGGFIFAILDKEGYCPKSPTQTNKYHPRW